MGAPVSGGLGTTGDDRIFGDGRSRILGLEGDDYIEGNEDMTAFFNGEEIYGGHACETTGTGNDTLLGLDGDDTVYGWDGDDIVYGGYDSDELYGGDGHDTLAGGRGPLEGGIGVDHVYGGDGDDLILVYDYDLLPGDLELPNDTYRSHGDAGFDTLSFREETSDLRLDAYGTDGIEALEGGRGDDTIDVLGGLERVDGREGHDVIFGAANVEFIGGAGVDQIIYRDAAAGVTVYLDGTAALGGAAIGARHRGIENVVGSVAGDDRLHGDGAANELRGRAQDDYLFGGGGADTLLGGSGRDVLEGGVGADLLDGAAGEDTASYASSKAAVLVRMEHPAFPALGGDAMGDKFVDIENIRGSHHDDVIETDGGDNKLWGAFGDDVLSGKDGDDTLVGGVGDDTLEGGEGADVFRFNAERDRGSDLILDYEEGVDRVEIFGAEDAETFETDEGFVIVIDGDDPLVMTFKNTWEVEFDLLG